MCINSTSDAMNVHFWRDVGIRRNTEVIAEREVCQLLMHRGKIIDLINEYFNFQHNLLLIISSIKNFAL